MFHNACMDSFNLAMCIKPKHNICQLILFSYICSTLTGVFAPLISTEYTENPHISKP